MQREKGITMISLVIMIVIIAILLGTAVYSGTQSLQEAKKTRFITELRMIHEKIRLSEYSENGNMIGVDYTSLSDEKRKKILPILESKKIEITDFNGYRYLTKENLEKDLQLSGITRNVLINFETKDVISEQGIRVNENLCYTLRQAEVSDYITAFKEEEMKANVTFEIRKIHKSDTGNTKDKWLATLTQIKTGKYSQKYESYYRKHDTTQDSEANWKRMENNQVLIDPGKYDFKVKDSYGNQAIKTEDFPYFDKR